LTDRRHAACGVAGLLVVVLSAALSSTAQAQGAAHDASGSLSAAPADQNKSWWERRFGGSYAELSTFVGSGTFYVSGYHNPYVSNALYLRPSYQLGTKYDLSLNARAYLEVEYTQPDNPNGRRYYPLDTWIYLAAKNLYTEPRSKVRFAGTVRAVVPTSYESMYAHLITGIGAGGTAGRAFAFGPPDAAGKRWGLALVLGTVFTKYLRTSALRGNGPAASTGCQTPSGAPPAAAHTLGTGLPSASDSDRCGGPLNTSYSFMTSAGATLTRKRWSLAATLIVINEFKYALDDPALSSMYASITGRADWTWGILSLGYSLSERYALSAGLSSYQPALNAQATNVRVPFFDFNGGDYNNYTQVFVGVNGTL
jgi:hypothetical protein